MPSDKPFRILIAARAKSDRLRLVQYSQGLDTQTSRLNALATGIKALGSNWSLNPYFDRSIHLKVRYVNHWYSVFYTVDALKETVTVVAILAQSEDINRLEG